MRYKVYATGFNAWGQLDGSGSRLSRDDDEAVDANAHAVHADFHLHDDRVKFAPIYSSDEKILGISSFLSYTMIETPSHITTVGWIPEKYKSIWRKLNSKCVTGKFAQALDGTVVVRGGDASRGTIGQYSSIEAWAASTDSSSPQPSLPDCTDIIQIVAYHTGFAALSSSGKVWTFGDERYGACLGRETTAASPATEPGLVTALEDLPTGPIVRLAAGGFLVGALTAGHDLYVWGGRPGLPPVVQSGVSADPEPVVVCGKDDDEPKDIIDVGVGDSHVIVLTTDNEVYVKGNRDCRNGQLGLGSLRGNETLEQPDDFTWAKVPFDGDERPYLVAAGPKQSFVVTQIDAD